MISIGIRDLKNNLSRYIRHIEAGERIAVTDHGRVVAEIVPPMDARRGTAVVTRYNQLVAAGLIRPPIEKGDPLADWPTASEIRLPAGTATSLIDEDRGGR